MTITSSQVNTGGNCMVTSIKVTTADNVTRYYSSSDECFVEHSQDVWELDGDHDLDDYTLWTVSYDTEDWLLQLEKRVGATQLVGILIEIGKGMDTLSTRHVYRFKMLQSEVMIAADYACLITIVQSNKDIHICRPDANKTLMQHLISGEYVQYSEHDLNYWLGWNVDNMLFDISRA